MLRNGLDKSSKTLRGEPFRQRLRLRKPMPCSCTIRSASEFCGPRGRRKFRDDLLFEPGPEHVSRGISVLVFAACSDLSAWWYFGPFPALRVPRLSEEDNGGQVVSTMSSLALLQSLKESILSQANVKAIYGEPIVAQGKTVIPVAKIMYGYGAGAGTGGVGTSSARGEGGGGGGGARAIPVGVIEVSDQPTRFVPITNRKKLAAAILVGVAFGTWLGWRRRR